MTKTGRLLSIPKQILFSQDNIREISRAARIDGRAFGSFTRHHTLVAARKILADLVKEPTK